MICRRKQKIVSARVAHTHQGGTWVALVVDGAEANEDDGVAHGRRGQMCNRSGLQDADSRRKKEKKEEDEGEREEAMLFPPPLSTLTRERKTSHQELESLHEKRGKAQGEQEDLINHQGPQGGGREGRSGAILSSPVCAHQELESLHWGRRKGELLLLDHFLNFY